MTETRLLIPLLLLCASMLTCGRNAPDGLAGQGNDDSLQTLQPLRKHPLGSFTNEPSGIAVQPVRGTLLVVSDAHQEVYEIDLQGKLLRSTTLSSADMEGIAVSGSGDTVFIADEKNRRIHMFRADGTRLSSFAADLATEAKHALEGVTVGPNGELHVLNERDPGIIVVYTLRGTELRRIPLAYADDYSDIAYDQSMHCYWIISDESMKILKVDLNGSLLAQWRIPFSKGEGIAVAGDTLYVVNDEDAALYVFAKPQE